MKRLLRLCAGSLLLPGLLASLLLVTPSGSAVADDYPSHPVRFIVPFLAGGGVDVAARILAQKLGEQLHQQFFVENRPGGGGVIGATDVAKATPDGYTLLFGPGDFATRPSLMPEMTFDPHRDLVPVAMVSSNPMLLVAGASSPYRSMADIVAAAKSRPGDIGYATPGTGTLNHVAGEWIAANAGIKLLHVPYRGGGAAANAIAAGDVPLGVVSPPVVQALIDAGQIKVIGLTGKDRPSSVPPSWPTLKEEGLDIDAVFWVGIFAPAGTPDEIMALIERETGEALKDPQVQKSMVNSGLDPTFVPRAAFVARINEEAARYDRIIAETGIKLEH